MKKSLKSVFLQLFKGIVFMAFIFISSSSVYAQTKNLRGSVKDASGYPLIGAGVVIKGTTVGAVADDKGEFNISVSESKLSPSSVLLVTFIGFKNQEITIGDKTVFDLTLEDDIANLQEVVAIGYGKVSRASVTSSISKIDAETLASIPVSSNAATALIGKVSGVTVAQTDGRPSASPKIWIRGGTDTDPTNDSPLYVIDGVVRENMDDINMSDISSFNILKDAASTAIYGARAANGVIVITTKTGSVGANKIAVKYSYEKQNTERYKQEYLPFEEEVYYARIAAARSYGDQWSAEYYGLLNSASYTGTGGSEDGRTSLQLADDVRAANGGVLPDTYISIMDPVYGYEIAWEPWDWQEQVFKDGDAHNFNVDFSGGNEMGRFYLSLNYYENSGTSVGASYNRYSLAGNFDYKVKKNLKVGTIFNWNLIDNGMGGYDSSGYRWYERAGRLPSTVRYQNSTTGEYVAGNSGKPNPDYWLDNYTIEDITRKSTVSAYMEWDIIDNLTFRPFFSVYTRDRSYGSFAKKNAYDGNRTATGTSEDELDTQVDAVLSYVKSFNDIHSLNAVLGTSFINEYEYTIGASTYGAGTDLIPTMNAGVDENDNVSSTLEKSAVQSWFGRVNYSYDDKYIASVSLRRDGASNFSENNKWANFPGVSAGWNLHKEDFWSVSKINSLKLRASYGQTGKNNISIYDTQGQYSAVQYKGNSGVTNTTLANDQLVWESTSSYDIGFDMELFDGKLGVLFDYYYKNSTDRLYNKDLPSYTGFASIKTNYGTYINRGVEVELTGQPVSSGDITWDVSFNWSYNRGTVGKLPENGKENNRDGGVEVWDQDSQSYKYIGGVAEGERPDQLIGYVNEGVFSTQAEADAYHVDDTFNKAGWGLKRAGDTKWGDLDNNGVLDSKDQKVFGYELPSHRGGLTNTVSWKDLYLNFVVDWALGHTVYNYSELRIYANSQGEDRASVNVQNGWMYEGDSDMARISRGDQNGPGNTQRPSGKNGAYYLKGDYLAFREVSLGYSLPSTVLSKVPFIKSAKFNLSGRNLGWIKDKDLRNPESISGEDRYMYPVPVIYNFGANLTF